MAHSNQTVGRYSENLAAHYLRGLGYKILQRNFRTPIGEIDIIAEHEGVLVFVEVKGRTSNRFGHPKWALTAAKRRRISMVALAYLKKQGGLDRRSRFDVVTIRQNGPAPVIELIANAFDLAHG